METRPFQFTGRIRSFGHAIAGAVLITALASSVIGAIIFWPHVTGSLGATRSTHAEIFVMSNEYASPTPIETSLAIFSTDQ
jgi:hypothetical protein